MSESSDRFRANRSLWYTCFAAVLLAAWPSVVLAGSIIAAMKSKVYHTHPDRCASARNIEQENRISFDSTDEAEAEGRRLCKFCAKLDARQDGPKTPPRKATSSPPDRANPEPKPEMKTVDKSRKYDQSVSPPVESAPPALATKGGRVKSVLSGGTLVLESGERVRLAGVACPTAGQLLAEEVTTFILSQTRGRKVQLAWHLGDDGVPIRDELGRIPAFVTTAAGDPDLAEAILAEGLGWVDWSSPCFRRALYLAKEDDAAWSQRGVWKRLDGPIGRIEVIVGKHTHDYHAPTCPHTVYLTEPVTITLNEAKGRRLAPCDRWRDEMPKK